MIRSISDTVINRLQVKVRLTWFRWKIKFLLKRNGPMPPNDNFWKIVTTKQELTIRNRWLKSGRKIRLSDPATLGEKLEWLKLNYHHPLYVQMSDKLAARDYVRDRRGGEY